MTTIEPNYGFYPKTIKSHLIINNKKIPDAAIKIFKGCEVQITLSGERHLSDIIGSVEYKTI